MCMAAQVCQGPQENLGKKPYLLALHAITSSASEGEGLGNVA